MDKKILKWCGQHKILTLLIGIMFFSILIQTATYKVPAHKYESQTNINENYKKTGELVEPEISNNIETINETVPEVIVPEEKIIEEAEVDASFTVANWNLQIFGKTKASNSELMQFYIDTISRYDIVFIQEIRDSTGTAFEKLCNYVVENYDCEVSSRAGRSSSKEQYGVIYRKNIEIKNFEDLNPDKMDRWERPPVKVTFAVDDYELIVYNLHAKPDDVQNEMEALESIVDPSEGNVVVLGDLNADCSYYSNSRESEFDSWTWLIEDHEDTTSSATDCAYDRILVNDDANAEISKDGILSEGITKDISDHYLVWVQFGTEDTEVVSTQKIVVPQEKPVVEEEEEEVESKEDSDCPVYASKNSKLYHTSQPVCDKINPENLVCYDSVEEAKKDGKERQATRC